MSPRPIRPWTPDRILLHRPSGQRAQEQSPKRRCTGCGLLLGDLTEVELLHATRGWNLRDNRAECPHCQGVHLILVRPEPREPGWKPDDGDEVNYHVVCPHMGGDAQAVTDCAEWRACGCTPPADPLSVEFERFLDQTCPNSPTGEHRHMPALYLAGEHPVLSAPVAGTCWYAVADHMPDAAADAVGTTPGIYPVECDAFDETTPTFNVLPWPPRSPRRDAKVPSQRASTG